MTTKGKDLEKELTLLKAKKENRFLRVQRLYDQLGKLDDPRIREQFEINRVSLDKTVQEFEELLDRINIISLQLEADYRVDYQALDAVDSMACAIRHVGGSAVVREEPTDDPLPLSRLQPIELPIFSGDPIRWPTFHDTFVGIIHNNPKLSPIAKVYYLLGALRGPALELASRLEPTSANYPLIWDSLVKKYRNPRRLADSHLQRMLEFRPLTSATPENLNRLSETFATSFEALRKIPSLDLADYFAASLALSKLDPNSRAAFETHIRSDIPTLTVVTEFLSEHADAMGRTLRATSAKKCPPPRSSFLAKPAPKVEQPSSLALVTKPSNASASSRDKASRCCTLCRGPHLIYSCDSFVKASIASRWDLVKKHNLCLNCLSNVHKSADCKSQSVCRVCRSRHHSLLHREEEEKAGTSAQSGQTAPKAPAQNFLVQGVSRKAPRTLVILPTALVRVTAPNGEFFLRLLIDSGSQVNLISLKGCRKLGLRISKGPPVLGGIGGLSEPVRGRVNFVFSARADHSIQYEVNALVLRRITCAMPPLKLESSLRKRLSDLPLADPGFDVSGDIDGILGAEIFSQILGKSPPVQFPHGPSAVATRLGYIIMGKASVAPPSLSSPRALCAFDEPSLDQVFRSFLESEEVGSSPSEVVDACEELFAETTLRNEEGRFVVHLPFAESPPKLGDSFTLAKNRLLSLEKHFHKSDEIRDKYHEAMKDYLDQGHISLAEDQNTNSGYFIPHFAVHRESSSTPVRIVFDASAKSTNGKSLNDVLRTGPKLQTDIQAVLLRFRIHPAALVADLRQMFRNILVDPSHRSFQRLLWRFNSQDSIQIYQLNCVPFGLKCAPFLALRTVKQLAEEEKERFPIAARIADLDMYVDDVVTSVPEEETSEVVQQLIGLFRAGGFTLAKWTTNSEDISRELPEEDLQESVKSLDHGDVLVPSVKVLGLHWDAKFDNFFYAYTPREVSGTKREILSTLARIWDPLGFLAPITLLCKTLLKKLWLSKCGWDDQPPEAIRKVWTQVSRELIHLKQISVPRYLGRTHNPSTKLVGFADSSEVGFGAVVYSMTQEEAETPKVTLLIAKSKVVPLKLQSIPRLELCAALLLARLFRLLKISLPHISDDQIIALSDSEDVLCWLSKPPYHWKTFVANRVSKIQEFFSPECWFHVPGKENIADLISRGATPLQLVHHPEWIHGPHWLTNPWETWPIRKPDSGTRVPLEERPAVALVAHAGDGTPISDLIERISSWRKLCRVVVLLLRFGKRLPMKSFISASDLEVAELTLVRRIQQEHFAEDFALLAQKKPLSSPLRFLSPFLHQGCIRVGGRLVNAALPFAKKHPLVLPKKCRLVDLIIDHFHVFYLHAGPTTLLSLLRQKFWILAARSVVRRRIHLCNRCFRLNPRNQTPSMGALPLPRVSETKPFMVTGVDYAGPFRVTIGRYRGVRTQKAYVALFVCFSTKAVHLELAADLSTEGFLSCFKRFIARRGPVSTIYSDCGTNFVGAKAQLQAHQVLIQGTNFHAELGNLLTANNVEWKFNPPSAPHFGGLWESNVKIMKSHLFRVIGDQILSWEEFYTLLTQIEAILNSRPLCVLSSDPADPEALTPAHFLTFIPLGSLPLVSPEDTAIPLTVRKNLLEHLLKAYWKRWRLEYLSSLQPRKRWLKSSDSLTVGSVVIVREDNAPPLHWPLGVIEEVHPGADGVVRVATVRLKDTRLRRPAVKLFPLPNQ